MAAKKQSKKSTKAKTKTTKKAAHAASAAPPKAGQEYRDGSRTVRVVEVACNRVKVLGDAGRHSTIDLARFQARFRRS